MKLGILQTGRSPEELRTAHGDYDDFFRRFLDGRGFEFVTYPVLDGILPAEPDEADCWLITGSKFGTYEPHPWIPPLEAFLRRSFTAGVPIVGICFGHQILAQALGGKVEKFAGGWSVGRETYEFAGLASPIALMAWHQDQVIEKPSEAEVLGSSPFCRYAALAYGDRALTIQPHPEFQRTFVRDLIEARRDLLPDDIARKALVSLGEPTDSALIGDMVEAFLKRPRGTRSPENAKPSV
ncbi:type 1 glutamine amidotransferase [Limibaculum sp. M0105]|uniref:Type 1 glutamine amidotransferase n=1 Tax=Thermohalobaculum xanthum TaxID=2753746 RepID=A0A8J7M668_9RHOB|nr:type 1 glutamine amidotransferase [Thermohalobaculum xanthum]MBK0398229.1 type 1 glutamine amidotransferase [Thermohalobaculum xanthum]